MTSHHEILTCYFTNNYVYAYNIELGQWHKLYVKSIAHTNINNLTQQDLSLPRLSMYIIGHCYLTVLTNKVLVSFVHSLLLLWNQPFLPEATVAFIGPVCVNSFADIRVVPHSPARDLHDTDTCAHLFLSPARVSPLPSLLPSPLLCSCACHCAQTQAPCHSQSSAMQEGPTRSMSCHPTLSPSSAI